MNVEIWYSNGDGTFKHMANMDLAGLNPDSDENLLEFAYVRTQNHMGSWSQGPEFEDGERNSDFHPAITVIELLHVDEQGRTWGHRSSMMGDIFKIKGKSYEVDFIGFEEIIEEKI